MPLHIQKLVHFMIRWVRFIAIYSSRTLDPVILSDYVSRFFDGVGRSEISGIMSLEFQMMDYNMLRLSSSDNVT